MKKKLFLMFVLLISIFFININYGKCDIENQSNNQNGSASVTTGGSINSSKSYFDGNLMQGIYVRIYDGETNQLKSGTSGTYFFVSGTLPELTNGIKNYYLCNPVSNSYSFSSYKINYNTCKAKSLAEINNTFKNGNYIMDSGKMFDLIDGQVKAYATQFTAALGNDSNNYATFNRILKDIGYFNLSNTSLKDFAVIEPVVTVIAGNSSSNRNVYIGIVNALMQNNIAFRDSSIGGWDLISIYSVIASSYKSKMDNGTTSECKQIDPRNTSKIRIVDAANSNGFDYTGCGYNKYVISEKAKYCVYDSARRVYYKRDGTSTTSETEYKNSCECYQTNDGKWHIKYGDGKSYNYDDPTYANACHPVTDIECVTQAANKNPFSRINLFNECKDNGCKLNITGTVESKVYENLLNFNLNGDRACTSRDELSSTKSCLRASYNVDENGNMNFTATDLSNFTETNGDIAPGSTAYCSYGFKLTSDYSYSNKVVNPGRFYIGGTADAGSEIAKGTLTLKCYLYVENPGLYVGKDPFENKLYSDYISTVSMKETPLSYTVVSNSKTVGTANVSSKYVEYTKTIIVSYKMPAVNIEKITGFVVNEASDKTDTVYGFYSLYSDDKGKHYDPFKVVYSNGLTSSSTCEYTVEKPELKLEFRTIDTSNPFLGKNNTSRKVGANWCSATDDGKWDCSSDNDTVKKYITNRNNSYNILNQAPKYKFVLTPKTIKTIKDYNKKVLERGEDIVIIRENGKDVYQFFKEIQSSMDENTRKLLLP